MTHHPLRILRFKQVMERVGLKHTCLYEKIKNKEFPQPIPLGTRAVGFLEDEVNAWIAERVIAVRGASSDADPKGKHS